MGRSLIQITALTEEARRGLTSLERDQFPFALAKTLTQVAEMAVKGVQAKTRQKFSLHSAFIPKGISRTSASKQDVKATGVGTTVVFTKPIISEWMPIHEEGGIRTAHGGSGKDKGKYMAIPAGDLLKRSYRTGTGRVRKQYRPDTLLAGYKGQRNTSMTGGVVRATRGGRKGKPFIIRGKGSNTPMIVRRKGPRRYPLELLYIFSRKSKYKPQWNFERTVDEIVDLRFEMRLKHNLRLAVQSAK